ncbi:HlyD family type I secretion periplasmic adaptor subunit [Azospirillum sp.]|uniref:HlyD family type I secretion periplasmic adaptor subunit n=1 Tax=Azospirillum sp. TaxID=34012 RepID=UPI002D2C2341|nr:HlyD family type I secretion periplasmic adaptor subunit [Azospirillum sp.]HYD64571.1 HlyD family type I secretion periplasmic adaptor subunit [Azospirillum sp.]
MVTPNPVAAPAPDPMPDAMPDAMPGAAPEPPPPTPSRAKPPAPVRRAIPAEALEFLPDALMIEERPLPWAARAVLYALLAMVVTALVWAWASQVDKVVSARGRLVTTPPTVVVQPIETSIIRTIEVQVGQRVEKGQMLATLDPTFAQADLSQMRSRMRAVSALIGRLEAELAGQPFAVDAAPGAKEADEALTTQASLYRQRMAQYQARLKSFEEAIAQKRAAQETNRRDQIVLKQRADALAEIETMRSQLLKTQSASRLNVLEATNLKLEVERDRQLSVYRAEELDHELANALSERTAFIEEWRQKLLEELIQGQRERDQVFDALEKAKKRSELVALASPVEGIVQEVARKSAGSVVREAEPVVTLVPLDTPIEAEARVEARDIGNIRVGDNVRLKIDAFPFQKHGVIAGKVRAISHDSFTHEGQAAAMAEAGAEAFYVVRVSFDKVTLRDVPPTTRLIPGMTLTGEIVVGKRDVLSYFIYPVIRVFDESIREP